METTAKDQSKIIVKVNYKEKNLEYIEKIKEKKLKEAEEKANQQRKDQLRKQNLKKKVLELAKETRENRRIQNQEHPQLSETEKRKQIKHKTNFDSLPKIHQTPPNEDQLVEKVNYKERYISFLQNLHQNIKSKKEIQEQEKKKKQGKYQKLKEEMGINKIESKIASCFKKNDNLIRSHSAEKHQQKEQEEDLLPKTNKNFKKKNQQYLERIKKKRQEEEQAKEQQRLKKEKLKEKLKDFVMVTVKKNVQDGVYDDQIEKKKNPKNNYMKQNNDDIDKEYDGQESGEQSEDLEQEQDKVKKKKKIRSFPYVTDIVEWRKKNRLQPDTKIFIVNGGYNDLKKALRERGWVHNPDYNSPCFNLKYTLQAKQIDYDKLQDFQLANHFLKSGCITTKSGLTRSLKSLIWINDTSSDNFFPKSFDLNDQDDYAGFEAHFKLCKALSIIKIYVNYVEQFKVKETEKVKETKNAIEDLKLRTQVALCVCKKNIQELDEIIDKKKFVKVVTDKQWQILSQDELNEQSLAKKKHEQWLKSIDTKFNVKTDKKIEKIKEKQKKPKKKDEKQKQVQNQSQQQPNKDVLYQDCKQVLETYQRKYPQFYLTGHNNIWILKPAGLSRGRGITCYNNLVQIQDHIKCKESQWISQKYIENPLVIMKRKFDIRQWVLVSDFNPLTIWIYDQPYIRFSAIDYDAKEVSNKFIHLTNNSIGAYYKEFQKSPIKGNMYFKSQFCQYLQALQGYNVYEQKIRPQIKQIVKLSLMCAVEHIQNRKNNHQLFGYDLMVDTNYKVWLIQINSSPSMDFSTHVTTKLVKDCLQDIVKVIVDYPSAPKKQRKQVDTGKFKRIYKGIEIPDKPITSGLNLCLEGVAIKKPKKNYVKIQSYSLEKQKS